MWCEPGNGSRGQIGGGQGVCAALVLKWASPKNKIRPKKKTKNKMGVPREMSVWTFPFYSSHEGVIISQEPGRFRDSFLLLTSP